MADPVELTVVQVRDGDRWRGVAVIDGRNYPDRASFDQAVMDAFDTLAELRIPSQLATRDVTATEPPSQLPAWYDYRKTLAPKGAGETE
ncbi:hypothetical protein EV644_110170 [Kribbella orskensis]|uniref:DUF2188 domain-containing protein n=1 Tax=Kribbella orskensis TaxID=2512216 RepID=A0ABY2BH94_9ACTN|nr:MULTISPECIES: hypothetical protein [Kribbella]TCN38035.1 hypothetical protein EV642_110192 [Kribbella sp. VKM Ac-2500]TCO19522.1 hypothetical protein EV644_110170 [Kribbella orskensis]